MEMGLIEKVWFLITFSIISIILITDPKDPVATSSTTPIATLFSSASKRTKVYYSFKLGFNPFVFYSDNCFKLFSIITILIDEVSLKLLSSNFF